MADRPSNRVLSNIALAAAACSIFALQFVSTGVIASVLMLTAAFGVIGMKITNYLGWVKLGEKSRREKKQHRADDADDPPPE